MTDKHSTITVLIPLVDYALEQHTKPGVNARKLYAFLELNPAAWARWTKKNIVSNPYAIEHTDWEAIQPDVENRIDTAIHGGRPTQDYVLSIDLAKKLAMMSRSSKGEEARQYFLACERMALQKDAANPWDMLIQMAEAGKKQAEQICALETQQKAQMIETIKAQELALMALRSQQWIALRQYVSMHKLESQLPESAQSEYGKWLVRYCAEKGFPVYGIAPADRKWDKENTYPVQAIADTLEGWLMRRHGQSPLTLVQKPSQPETCQEDAAPYTPRRRRR